MAVEHLMNLLTEAEQALASVALPPADTVPCRPCGAIGGKTFTVARCRRTPPVPTNRRNTTVTLRIELGRAQLRPDELVELRKGSVVPLDKMAGDAVDIYADERLAARGEVVEVDGNFGIRVVELVDG